MPGGGSDGGKGRGLWSCVVEGAKGDGAQAGREGKALGEGGVYESPVFLPSPPAEKELLGQVPGPRWWWRIGR